MKSNDPMMEGVPNEEKVTMAKIMVAHSSEKVAKAIDGLTSASLKRVLKAITHTHLADAILEKETKFDLSEEESSLIDTIFALQETVMGASTLIQEVENGSQENGLEQVSLTTTLEEGSDV